MAFGNNNSRRLKMLVRQGDVESGTWCSEEGKRRRTWEKRGFTAYIGKSNRNISVILIIRDLGVKFGSK